MKCDEFFYETYKKLGYTEEQIEKDWESFVEDMDMMCRQEKFSEMINFFKSKANEEPK